MCKRRLRWGAWVGIAAALFVARGFGQTPTHIVVLKLDEYLQTSPTGQSPNGADFVAVLDFGLPTAPGLSVQLTSPIGRKLDLTLQSDGTFSGTENFSGRADLDAAYPDGNYSVTVGGQAGGTTKFGVSTGSPVAPTLITNFTDLQATPTSAPTVSWQPIAGSNGTDLLNLVIAGEDGTVYYQTGDLFDPQSTSANAFSLPLNTPLVGALSFGSIVLSKAGSVDIGAGRGFVVGFPLRVSLPAPTVTRQPIAGGVPPGGTYTLSVTATGGGTLSYQWKRDGVTIPGATDPTYRVGGSDSFAGVYTVDVRNQAGATTSNQALITLISSSPYAPSTPQFVRIGSPLSIKAEPVNSSLTYQWKRNGSPVPGATTAKFSLSAAQASDAGAYTVDVANPFTAATAGPIDVLVNPSATLTTIAGQFGVSGSTDGPAGTATLSNMVGLAIDHAGNFYTVDSGQQTVRKIAPDGSITTFAGSPGKPGLVDGTGTAAQLQYLSGIAVDPNDNVYVTEYFVGLIRKITPQGVVTWFSGNSAVGRSAIDGPAGSAGYDWPGPICATQAGIFVLDTEQPLVRHLDWNGTVSTVKGTILSTSPGGGPTAQYFNATCIAADDSGSVYVGAMDGVRKILPDGRVLSLAGQMGQSIWPGDPNGADGVVGAAMSSNSAGAMATDGRGTLYFCDGYGFRRITPDGLVQTLLPNRKFSAIAVDHSGNVYVADSQNSVIARVTVLEGGTYSGLAITQPPSAQTIASGATTVLTAAATGPGLKYQWFKNGLPLAGANEPTFIAWSPQPGDTYAVAIGNAGGVVRSQPMQFQFTSTTDVSRIVNLSVRAHAGSDAQTLTVGAVLGRGNPGSGKSLVIRGVGPTLQAFGVGNALSAVNMTLLQGTNVLAANSQWDGTAATTAAFDTVGAFHLPLGSKDAVLTPTLGAALYSVEVTSPTASSGVALAELYDAQPNSYDPTSPRLINVSARCQVGTGDDVLIAGFAVVGSTPKTVLIRASGPSLAGFGVTGTLADPQLELHRSDGTLVATNDNWGGSQALRDAFSAVGAFGFASDNSFDSALIITVPPGVYSAVVRGANTTTGVALVEVYEVP